MASARLSSPRHRWFRRLLTLTGRRVVAGALLWLGIVAGGIGAPPAAPPPTYANRLIDSNDPYLLLHAHNPVDWYPWGEEAFARAKRENRPIFLSIGYSTCFWCHVAERTIYADPEIARLMNDWFVNIKVDREQRPDVDSVYMLATQLLTHRGGWPNNLFLTPDLKPFYAGSYFPPEEDGSGRPGFKTILRVMHTAWITDPKGIAADAEAVVVGMREARVRMASGDPAALDPGEWLRRARAALLRDFDREYGGSSTARGSKFPLAPVLALLMNDYRNRADKASVDALTNTLDAIAFGGIRDHLGGGFHRYAVERSWSIPHFEKMLYDNAQLLRLYGEAYRLSGKPLYRQVAEETARYLERQMMAPEGGFYTAEDAETGGREGATYLWSRREIDAALGKIAARRFLDTYALVPIPGPGGVGDARKGVLRVGKPGTRPERVDAGARQARALAALSTDRARLLALRARRAQPARDEKMIVAVNALAIEAFARSREWRHDDHYLDLAKRSAERIWRLAYDTQRGELKHEIFRGRAQTDGYLDDYALLAGSFMSLYEVTRDDLWCRRAATLAARLLRRFAYGNGLATTTAVGELLLPPQDSGDGAYPAGTSAAVDVLLRLSAATGDRQYAQAAARIAGRASGAVAGHPEAWPAMIVALDAHGPAAGGLGGAVTVRGPRGEPRQALDSAAHVHATASMHRLGDRDQLRVAIRIDAGYHVNGNPASFEFLVPTSLLVDGTTPQRIRYPPATRFKPAFAGEALDVYSGSVTVVADLAKGLADGGKAMRVALRVQACNEEACLPPAVLPLLVEGK